MLLYYCSIHVALILYILA